MAVTQKRHSAGKLNALICFNNCRFAATYYYVANIRTFFESDFTSAYWVIFLFVFLN